MIEKSDDGFRNRFKELLGSFPSLGAAAEMTGYSYEQLAKWRDGKARPPFQPLAILCAAAGRSLDWLAHGREPGGPSLSAPMMSLPEEAVMIPRLSVRASAGIGVKNHDHPDAERVPISRALLRRLGIRPEAAHVIEASGDSMEPTIRDADEILVHAGALAGSEVRSEGIYVVILDDVTMIKRLQPILGALQLISDNERYAPIVIPRDELERLRVIGQVRMVMRVV